MSLATGRGSRVTRTEPFRGGLTGGLESDREGGYIHSQVDLKIDCYPLRIAVTCMLDPVEAARHLGANRTRCVLVRSARGEWYIME
jgi:hypothetical protein